MLKNCFFINMIAKLLFLVSFLFLISYPIHSQSNLYEIRTFESSYSRPFKDSVTVKVSADFDFLKIAQEKMPNQKFFLFLKRRHSCDSIYYQAYDIKMKYDAESGNEHWLMYAIVDKKFYIHFFDNDNKDVTEKGNLDTNFPMIIIPIL